MQPVSPMPIGIIPPSDLFPISKTQLPETDGEPLESSWHRLAMNVLVDSVAAYYRDRPDFYTAGNMFVYFGSEEAPKSVFRGPDFFAVWGRPSTPERRYWAVWDEDGHYPDVIVEFLSPTTADKDLGSKKDLYQDTFRTTDYFCYDPDRKRLLGWTLMNGIYTPLVANPEGRLWSRKLDLWVGRWEGSISNIPDTWPRFFTSAGALVLLDNEIEKERANALKTHADAQAVEIARLRTLLAEQGTQP